MITMQKLFWILAIIGTGVVFHFDDPDLRHPADISKAEKRDVVAAYTTVDEYLAVTLNAKRRK